MYNKGQFMIISAIVASLITISLSASISTIQSHTYETETLSNEINQVKTEIRKITVDNEITTKEERNFLKMLGYLENYETSASFQRGSNPCIQVTLQSPEQEIQMPCIN